MNETGRSVKNDSQLQILSEVLDQAQQAQDQIRRQFNIATMMVMVVVLAVAIVLSLSRTYFVLAIIAFVPLFTLVTLWIWVINDPNYRHKTFCLRMEILSQWES